MMALAFITCVIGLFALVLVFEQQPDPDQRLRPASLLRWMMAGNWTAKLGALLLSIGSGALLRYLMLHVTYPPALKILAGIAITAVLGMVAAVLAGRPQRRALSLALTGASLAVCYLTAYSAFGFFHFVADVRGLGLLFMVAAIATVVAIKRRALSIAVLAMAGAYVAPAFALHTADPASVYGYYVAASLVTSLMVWRRGWRPLIHLSFLFTLGGALFFGWTQKFYTPGYYHQMQPLLLILVAVHLAMPQLEGGSESNAVVGSAWRRRFDQAYFLILPLTAAVLTLLLAPRIQHEGVLGLLGLAVLWGLAAGGQQLRYGAGSVRYLAVAVIYLGSAGLLAVPDLPLLLIAAVVTCLVIAARPQLQLSRGAEFLAIAVALITSACYVLQAVFAPVTGAALFNRPFAEHLLLGATLLASGWSLHRRQQAMGPIFGIYAATWLCIAVARELVRLQYRHVAELLYLGTLIAIGMCLIVSRLRGSTPGRLVVASTGLILLVLGIASASRFPMQYALPLMLAGQILFSLLVLACDRTDSGDEATGAVARSALPVLLLPWVFPLAQQWSAPIGEVLLTLAVSSALSASLQAQWLVRANQLWPNWLSPVGFVLFGTALFNETLFHIERQPWAVAFELIALIYLVETARYLWVNGNRDAARFGYAATAAVATVSAAMLLRMIGPPGTLTILALDRMIWPACVSLLWAVIGGLLTWFSTRRRSRMLWSVGAVLLLAAALKLILLDFGSLGQIANILAMMAAGGVFLLVAWLAPFPPRPETPAPTPHGAGEDTGGRGWLWLAITLAIILVYGYWSWWTVPRTVPVADDSAPPPVAVQPPAPSSVPVLRAARDDDAPCGYFWINTDVTQGANQFVSKLLVHAVDGYASPDNHLLLIGSAVPPPPIPVPATAAHST